MVGLRVSFSPLPSGVKASSSGNVVTGGVGVGTGAEAGLGVGNSNQYILNNQAQVFEWTKQSGHNGCNGYASPVLVNLTKYHVTADMLGGGTVIGMSLPTPCYLTIRQCIRMNKPIANLKNRNYSFY